MNFTLRHIYETNNDREHEFIIAANRVWFDSRGEEENHTGKVLYDNGPNTPVQFLSGAGKVYVTNENGKTVATYHLGYQDNI